MRKGSLGSRSRSWVSFSRRSLTRRILGRSGRKRQWMERGEALRSARLPPRLLRLRLLRQRFEHLDRRAAAGDLVHRACLGRLVGTPAEELRAVAEAALREMIVLHFDD